MLMLNKQNVDIMKTIERRKVPKVTFQKSHGGRENYFPTKLKKDLIGDCVIRACAIASGSDYMETMKRLFEIGLKIGDLPNSSKTYEVFLFENGFKKEKQPRKSNNKYYQVNEFPAEMGVVYFIKVPNHVTTIIEKVNKDTWNCGEMTIRTYYSKKQ